MTAGSCIRAGFMLHFEDEGRPGKHPEFIATYPGTGRRLAVECKRRLAVATVRSPAKSHLNKALEQNRTGLPLITFIELIGRPSIRSSKACRRIHSVQCDD